MLTRRSAAIAAVVAALLSACVVVPASSTGEPLALGDSITVGAAAQFEAAGFEVDAEVGRSFVQGLAILRARGASLPDRIVVNLGTNSGVTRSQCDDLVSMVGGGRALTLITVNIPAAPKIATTSNAVLADCASRGGATLIDWAGYVVAHPGVVCGDGMHISCGGAGEYARFVLSHAAGAPQQQVADAGSRGAVSTGAAGRARGPSAIETERAAAAAAAAEAAQLEGARAEAAAAEVARLAAERQRQLDYLHSIDSPQPVPGADAAGSYGFMPVAVRLSLLASS